MPLFKDDDEGPTAQAFLKMGIYGGTGSGKTYTACLVARGLAQLVKERTGVQPPVKFLDTETGSAWVRPMFKEAGIRFQSAQTRAFSDLLQAVREAESERAILIIDSISHFWAELMLSFAQKRKRKYNKLEFQDYGPIKQEWAKFTEAYLNSNAHIILNGRAGNIYEYQDKEDEDTGRVKKELITVGTKMKAENEMGYEPSLLVEMVAVKDPDRKKKLTKRIGYVIKDRSTLLDGREFINPTFQVFRPHIDRLNIGGDQKGFDASRNSSALFDQSGRTDGEAWRLQKDIVLEEVANLLTLHYPGQSADEKRRKVAIIRDHFAATWKEMESVLSLERLREGYNTMHIELEGKPSRYHEQFEELDDEIPDFGARANGTQPSPQSSPPAGDNRQAPETAEHDADGAGATTGKRTYAEMKIGELKGATVKATAVMDSLSPNDLEARRKAWGDIDAPALITALNAAGLRTEEQRLAGIAPPPF
ncbi:MAG: AAA family ATPase [Acetobacteraceae bacterium]